MSSAAGKSASSSAGGQSANHPAATPSPSLRGLCQAYTAHAADNPGKALDNPAFAALIALLLPAYVKEGKSYLSIGVGCTGGHHRSVVLAEELARVFERLGFPARVHHRDLERG